MQNFKRIIFSAILALTAISCTKDIVLDTPMIIPTSFYAQAPDFDSQNPESKSGALVEYLPESWDGPETVSTRTYAVPGGIDSEISKEVYYQYWSASDAVSVFFTTANLQYTFAEFVDEDNNGTQEQDYGHFTLAGTASSGTPLETGYYYAVYPYKNSTSINYTNGEITYNFPKNQTYNGDSYSDEENGMLAIEPVDGYDGKFYFQNFCSYLQLRLADIIKTGKKVTQIILESNNTNDKLSGNAGIKVGGGVPVVKMKMTASHQITLNCSSVELSEDIGNPTKFWFVLPGDFTFSEGFKVTVTFSDNSYLEKSTSKKISIARSHIKPMAAFGPEPEGGGDDIPVTGSIRYKYNNTNITTPYSLKDEFYDINGKKLQIINQVYDEKTGEWVVYLSGILHKIGGNCFEKRTPNIEYIKVEETTDNPIVIGDFAFYNCSADWIEITNDVESIGKSALEASTVKSLTIKGDVSEILEGAFLASTRLETFQAGSVEVIGVQAFQGCTNLETFSVTSVQTIEQGAFLMCTDLYEVSIPGVEYIGANAFKNCTSLESIVLDSIIKIEDAAFMGCASLTEVEISGSCIMIGEGAFCNAECLETVICYADKPPFIKTDNPDGSYVFDGTSEYLQIFIPDGSMSDYTDSGYFVNNNSGYKDDPVVKGTVNWWYQEYTGKLYVMAN